MRDEDKAQVKSVLRKGNGKEIAVALKEYFTKYIDSTATKRYNKYNELAEVYLDSPIFDGRPVNTK